MLPLVAGTQNVHFIHWSLGHQLCTWKFTYLESVKNGGDKHSFLLSLLVFLDMAT